MLVPLRLCQGEPFLQVPARLSQIAFAERRHSEKLEPRRDPSLVVELPCDQEALLQIPDCLAEATHEAPDLARAEERLAPGKGTFLSSCAPQRLHRQPMAQSEQAAVEPVPFCRVDQSQP